MVWLMRIMARINQWTLARPVPPVHAVLYHAPVREPPSEIADQGVDAIERRATMAPRSRVRPGPDPHDDEKAKDN